MKTLMNPKIDRQSHTIDATNQILGKLAVDIANKLRGKNKPSFTSHVDTGDYVTVINVQKVAFSGNKLDQKIYRRHSGYIGSMKETLLRDMIKDKPNDVIRHAVLGMLPKNRLRNDWIKRLKFEVANEADLKENK
jgi:large subunit ribosomal protein L13